MAKLTTALLQATNLILLMSNTEGSNKKFQLWTKEGENLTEVLPDLEITRVAVEDQAKIFEHPLETGTVIVDHMILEPQQATIQAYISLDDDVTLRTLEQLYLSGTKMTMRAENKIIENVIIKSKPKEITSSVLDKTLYSITFREAEEKEPVYVAMPPKKVVNKATSSRVNSGVKQAEPKKKSWLKSLFSGGRT
jgi:hypothetical protein